MTHHPTSPDSERAFRIVEAGRRLAAERFRDFPLLALNLLNARLVEQPDAPGGVDVTPPGDQGPHGSILFDTAYVLTLAEQHRHPVWVVCPRIERLVLMQGELWESDDAERARLVAHREQRRSRAIALSSRQPSEDEA